MVLTMLGIGSVRRMLGYRNDHPYRPKFQLDDLVLPASPLALRRPGQADDLRNLAFYRVVYSGDYTSRYGPLDLRTHHDLYDGKIVFLALAAYTILNDKNNGHTMILLHYPLQAL